MRRIALLSILLTLAACSGDGGGSNNSGGGGLLPTGPQSSTTFDVLIVVEILALPIDGGIGGIFEANLDFDGQRVSTMEWDFLGGGCAVCNIQGEVKGVSPGRHSVTFEVRRQAFSRMRYTLAGIVAGVDLTNGRTIQVDLPFETIDLRVGDEFTYNFTL